MVKIDFRELNPDEYVAVDITFYNEMPSPVQAKILEILNDSEPFWITTTQETRSYIIRKDLLEILEKIADNSVRVDTQSLQELKEDFENDPWIVADDYYVTRLRDGVYKF